MDAMIKRQDVINELTEVRERILNMPIFKEWIPCNEKLPECAGTYLVTWIGIETRNVSVFQYDSWGDWITEDYEIMQGEMVLAWMPLPDAYKEVSGRKGNE